jgi:hypothetical protein
MAAGLERNYPTLNGLAHPLACRGGRAHEQKLFQIVLGNLAAHTFPGNWGTVFYNKAVDCHRL